jgi:hypothetical protein
MIPLNGLVSPFPPFNWLLFLTFEFITIVVETVMCYYVGKVFLVSADGKKFDWFVALLLSFFMNIVSACIAIPIWLSLGVSS